MARRKENAVVMCTQKTRNSSYFGLALHFRAGGFKRRLRRSVVAKRKLRCVRPGLRRRSASPSARKREISTPWFAPPETVRTVVEVTVASSTGNKCAVRVIAEVRTDGELDNTLWEGEGLRRPYFRNINMTLYNRQIPQFRLAVVSGSGCYFKL